MFFIIVQTNVDLSNAKSELLLWRFIYTLMYFVWICLAEMLMNQFKRNFNSDILLI